MARKYRGRRYSHLKRRIIKNKLKTLARYYTLRFKEWKDPMATQLNNWLVVLDAIEKWILHLCEIYNIPRDLCVYYIGYAKKLFKLLVSYTGTTLQNEIDALIEEYKLRGLDPNVLNAIVPIIKGVYYGVIPSLTFVTKKFILYGLVNNYGFATKKFVLYGLVNGYALATKKFVLYGLINNFGFATQKKVEYGLVNGYSLATKKKVEYGLNNNFTFSTKKTIEYGNANIFILVNKS